MKKQIDSKKKNTSSYWITPIFLLIFAFSTIAYSSLNTTLNITADAFVGEFADIRISNIEYIGSENGGSEQFSPNYNEKNMTTSIILPNLNSTVTYKVTATNYGNITSNLAEILVNYFGNPNITYTLTNTFIGDIYEYQAYKEFNITFKYKIEATLATSDLITSDIEYVFNKTRSILVAGADGTQVFGSSLITRTNVNSIKFTKSREVPLGTIGSWDAGIVKNGSVMAYYKNSSISGKYDVIVSGYNGVEANPNSSYLFKGYSNLTAIDFNNAFDTSNVTNMFSMFNGNINLTELDINHFNTANVTDMSYVFNSVRAITTLDLSNWNTKKVTTMERMFSDCTNLIELDISGFQTPSLININYLFTSTNPKKLYMNNFDFSNITSPNKSMASLFAKPSLEILDISNINTTSINNMTGLFNGANNLESLNVSSMDTSSVTNMSYMFRGMSKLTSLDVSNFNTSNVEIMTGMFHSSNLTVLDLSNFDTRNVTTMLDMFNGSKNLEVLNLSNFDTPRLENMNNMFNNVNPRELYMNNFDFRNITFPNKSMASLFAKSNLEILDISNIKTTGITNMSDLFNGTSKLQNIDLKSLDTSNVVNMNNMFRGMTSLTALEMQNFNFASVTSYLNMLTNVPVNIPITLSSDGNTWFTPKFPTYTNINIVN